VVQHYTLVAGKSLSPSIAFTSIAVFDELRFALGALPETFIQALQGFVSCRRIEKYLQQEDVDFNIDYDGEGDIILANATFTWPRDQEQTSSTPGSPSAPPTPKHTFTLADLSLHFPKGQLSLICGRLGSGKSLLLAGLLGEADLLAGRIECPRSSPDAMGSQEQYGIKDEDWVVPKMLAYVPQQAWLQNASIKDNIVFSSPWDEQRYQAVLEACSLLSDLQILEDGDQT
jgi:ABC-type multidrug transport system fused ATPase/permease subunit